MIYLDSAATSLLKPDCVKEAVRKTMERCASPGRGSHEAALAAAEICYECREKAAELFHVPEPEQVVFTSNATHGLNIAIRSLVQRGDRAVISCWEHNAVLRPLAALGAVIDVAAAPLWDDEGTIKAFKERIPGARVVVCTHVSNVFGYVLPIDKIAQLCRENHVPLIVDASQSAGVLPLDFTALGCAFAAMPGHKGLMGPQGTGLLLCGAKTTPILFGGTGSLSRERSMPDFLPDRLEAGTLNVPGIAGLLEGMKYTETLGTEQISAAERRMLRVFADELGDEAGKMYLSKREDRQSGVLSLLPRGGDSEETAERLGKEGIAVRGGLHCAPLAHESAGTGEQGTVRFSFSPLLELKDVRNAARRCKEILKNSYRL